MSVTSADPGWYTTLPFVIAAKRGESAASFMLTHDDLNGFLAGRTLRITRKAHQIRYQPAAFLRGDVIDWERVSELTAQPIAALEALTLRPVFDGLFGSRRRPLLFGQRRRFLICPSCIRERSIPLVSLFERIDGCLRHGTQLVGNCRCEAPIRLFAWQRPYTCDQCGLAYEALRAPAMEHSDVDRLARWQRVYEDLFFRGVVVPGGLNSMELARVMRTLARRSADRSQEITLLVRLKSVRQSAAPFEKLVAVYAASATSPADLARAVAEVVDHRSHWSQREGCPNPACPAPWSFWALRREGALACKRCATTFHGEEIAFSLVALQGYPAWRAERNASRLREHYAAAAATCDEWLVRRRWITQPLVFRAAGIPESHANFCSNAGIRDLINTALAIQGRRYPGNRPLRPEDPPRARGVIAHRRRVAVEKWARIRQVPPVSKSWSPRRL